jgi:hypothetical protein
MKSLNALSFYFGCQMLGKAFLTSYCPASHSLFHLLPNGAVIFLSSPFGLLWWAYQLTASCIPY